MIVLALTDLLSDSEENRIRAEVFLVQYSEVIHFWFKDHGPKSWWQKDPEFDALIREKFLRAYHYAVAGELWSWRDCAEGRLAEVILLDQFSRNMFRGHADAFKADPLALALSQEAVRAGALENITDAQKPFLVMPYMHSESAKVHEQAVKIFSLPGLEGNLDFEQRHKAIIDRFGRYPHRNEALGRQSTAEELEFLKGPGSSF